jgi:hypothetical protein
MQVYVTRKKTARERLLDEKRIELDELEAELAQRELDLSTLQAELRALDLLYTRKVGARLAQLDLIEARMAEILARLNPEDRSARKQAQQARRKAEQAHKKAGKAQAAPEERTRFNPSEDLRALYREVAKRIHPDLASDPESRELRNRLMVDVNAAYQANDQERLEQILADWELSPHSVQGDGPEAELERLERKIAQVLARLTSMDSDFERLKSSFAYSLKKRIDRKSVV